MMIFMAGLIFESCYDKDNTIHRIPDLVIENVTGGSVKTGEVIEITPKCVMGGEEVECTYNWYRYRDTVLELISEDSHLEWRVDTVGSVTLEVEATHVESGIQAVLTFYYSITPRINGGWLILKETMDGNTDMDVSLIQANGIEFAADQLSLALGEPMKGKPISLLYTESYQWYDPETGTTETKQKCLIPVSQKDILMYRVADEKVLARNEELFFEMPDFGSSNISSFMQLAQSGGLICDGKAYLRSNVAFMPALLGNYHLAPNVVCWKYSNPMLVYDELNTSFSLLVGSSNFSTTMEVKYFADDYQPDDDLRISPNRMDAELIYLGQTDKSILSDPNKQGYGTAYALMKKNGDANNLLLYGLTVAEWYNATYGPIRFARTIPVSRCEAFATADFYTMHQTNNLIYFIKEWHLSNSSINTTLLFYFKLTIANAPVSFQNWQIIRLTFSSFTFPSSVSSQLSFFPSSIADTPLTAIRFRYNICIYNPISFFSQQNFITTRSCGSFPVNPAFFSVVFKTSSCSSFKIPY